MADQPIDQRRFSDREVRAILERAVDASTGRSLVRAEGLTLADLQSVAEEVGLDPTRLEEAAREVVQGRRNRPNRLLGAPLVVSFERRVPGEVTPDDTPDVLSVIRRAIGRQGQVADVHGSLEWSDRSDSGERYVTLSSKEGATTVTGSSNLANLAVLTYVPVGAMGAIASMVGLIKYFKNGSEVGLVLFFLILPVLYVILRTLFGALARSEERKMERVVDELARLTEESR